jgi:hypothetical protein
MATGPASWQYWRPSVAEMQSRTLLTNMKDSVVSPATTVGSATSISSRPVEEHRARLSATFAALNLGRRSVDLDRSDGDSSGFDYEDDDGEDDFKDLTACDSQCGYCGDCDY